MTSVVKQQAGKIQCVGVSKVDSWNTSGIQF